MTKQNKQDKKVEDCSTCKYLGIIGNVVICRECKRVEELLSMQEIEIAENTRAASKPEVAEVERLQAQIHRMQNKVEAILKACGKWSVKNGGAE